MKSVSNVYDSPDGIKIVIDNTVDWLRLILENTGTNGFVLGLSGGIDSAVCACLLSMAAGNNNVFGVFLDAGNSPADLKDAEASAQAAGIDFHYIDIGALRQGLYDAVLKADSRKGSGVIDDAMVKGNIGSRLRMTTLYGIANRHNYLVSGTDNADELYTGYFTKYGDGGVDILPLANFTKGTVYAIGRYLGVPEGILAKPPSAGLVPDQTDEKEMGVTYQDIDCFLKGGIVSPDIVNRLNALHRASQHKRQLAARPEGPLL